MKRSGFEPKASWKRLERSRTPMKRGKRINAIGPKTQTWIDVRKDIKQRFEWAGITTCEARLPGCWFDDGLGFAHCKKRRKIEGNELWHVALLCNHCHDIWERLPHEEMHQKIHSIIDHRGLIAPPAILQQVQGSQDQRLCEQERSEPLSGVGVAGTSREDLKPCHAG